VAALCSATPSSSSGSSSSCSTHGERPGDVLASRRPILEGCSACCCPDCVRHAVGVILTVQRFAPSLHNVPENPLQGLLKSPRDAWLFALVVVVAGGVRRDPAGVPAAPLRRLAGRQPVELVVTSIAFGAGHFDLRDRRRHRDGAARRVLGSGVLRRRSSVAPIVSHSGFNLLQIVPFLGLDRRVGRPTGGKRDQTRVLALFAPPGLHRPAK
jgi:hypothetical protein